METETWVDVENFEGLYRVSNLGRILSLEKKIPNKLTGGFSTRHERVLKPSVHKGYARVTLCKNGVTKKFFLHRLVAIHFAPNINDFPLVRHIDHNPLNNKADNLLWGDVKDNINDTVSADRHARGSRNGNHILVEENIPEIYRRAWSGEKLMDIASDFGVSLYTISNVKTGRSWVRITKNL